MKSLNVQQRRILAFMIDHLVWVILSVVAFLAVFQLLEDDLGGGAPASSAIFGLIVYFLGMLLRDWGRSRSLGKRWMKLRVQVEGASGMRVNLSRILRRNAALLLMPIEFILVALSDGRRIGDRWAETEVVSDGDETQKPIPTEVVEEPKVSLFDDFRFKPFFRKCVFWFGVVGSAAGIILFVAIGLFKVLGPRENEWSILQYASLFLVQFPLMTMVLGAAFAVLYFLPMRLFFRAIKKKK